MSEDRIRGMRVDQVYADEVVGSCSPWSTPLEPRRVTVIGGSPAMEMGGRPVIWFENWLRERDAWKQRV